MLCPCPDPAPPRRHEHASGPPRLPPPPSGLTSSAVPSDPNTPAAPPPAAAPGPWPLRPYADNGLADYIAHAKYARYRPDLGRWESWAEAVQRVEAMHRTFFADQLGRRIGDAEAAADIEPADRPLLAAALADRTLDRVLADAFAAVAAKRVLPSMRSLQFGGPAILRCHARLFNCAFSPADRPEFFREYFFLLLAGTGCGFSVQRHHVARLPALPPRRPDAALPVRDHRIADSIEGWADALHALLGSHLAGYAVRFDYGQIRACGQPVRTAGGFAPGPEPLRRTLTDAAAILRRAAGRQLRPIEVYDLCMTVARAVLSGGGRRSASICLFSADDAEMANAKVGAWLTENPQRAACNHSAVVSRAAADEPRFRQLFDIQKEFGEPGFFFSDHPDYGCNPCGEAGLYPVLPEPLAGATVARLRALDYTGELPPGVRLSGWQTCNLTTINGAAARRPEDFFLACVHAAAIGTLQAAYTDLAYLGPVTRVINERDALLGVSICGFMDHPDLLFAPPILERGARLSRATNRLVAAALGLRPATRVTCVKPEGTASLLLGAAAGIHPRPARHYFRRVQADRRDPVYRAFHAANPHMTETSLLRPATDDLIVFPVEAPARALVRDVIGAVEFLRRVRLVQHHWVLAGEAPATPSPGLHHNVSHTCAARPDEWPAVADFIWEHRADFTGVALLGDDAAGRYPQAPFQPVATAADAALWNRLHYRAVDYARAQAPAGDHRPDDLAACVAGACES